MSKTPPIRSSLPIWYFLAVSIFLGYRVKQTYVLEGPVLAIFIIIAAIIGLTFIEMLIKLFRKS